METVLKIKMDEFLAHKIEDTVKIGTFKSEENREDALKLRNRVDKSSQADIRRLEIFKYMIIVPE